VIFAAGFFDWWMAELARASNQLTRFGAFFDSVVDRYSDAACSSACFITPGGPIFYVVLRRWP